MSTQTTALSDVRRTVDTLFECARFGDVATFIKSQELPSERLRARCLLAWAQSSDPDTRRQLIAELGGVLRYTDAGAPVSS
jgi:hypothetical protein